MADTLESLEIEVKHKASEADSEIEKVTNALSKLGDAIDKVFPKLNSLAEAMNKVKNTKLLKDSFKSDDTKALSDDIQKRIANADKIDVLGQKLIDAEAKMKKAFEAGNKSGAYKARGEFIKTQEAIEKLLEKMSPEKPVSAMTKIANAVKKIRASAEKAAKPVNKLLLSFGRIAFYRAIRMALNQLAKAFEEGLKNAYAYSAGLGNAVDGRIAVALDKLSSSTLKMKNQLGAAFGSLLVIITPILNQLVGIITKAAEALTQLFAAFTGGTYLKAKDVNAKFAEDTAAGAEAAKEWKNQLMGFDEINRLEDNSGNGTGSGKNSIDTSAMYEVKEIDGIFKGIADKWHELMATIDFGPLLAAIATLKDAFSGLGEVLSIAFGWVWENILSPFITWFIELALPTVLGFISAIITLVTTILEALGPGFETLWNDILVPMFEWLGEEFIFIFQRLTEILLELSDVISGEIDFQTFWNNLSTSEKFLLIVIGVIAVLSAVLFAIQHPWIALGTVAILVAGWIKTHIEEVKTKLQEWHDKTKEVTDAIKGFFQDVHDFIAEKIEKIIEFIQKIIDKCKEAIEGLKNVFGLGNKNKQSGGGGGDGGSSDPAATYVSEGPFSDFYNKYRNFRYGGWAEGGTVPDGELFLAREAGPEFVGRIGSHTAVANNDQIVTAIQNGVFNAMSAALSGGSGRSGGNVVLNINGREFMRAIYDDSQAVAKERGISLVANG